MAKWFGSIGFVKVIEKTPGKWIEERTDRTYSGDLVRNTRKLQSSDSVNDNIIISNDISIVIDPYAYENFHYIRYAEFMGTKWKVTNAEVQYPRLILSLGDVYNARS